jgi:hypothetical protein
MSTVKCSRVRYNNHTSNTSYTSDNNNTSHNIEFVRNTSDNDNNNERGARVSVALGRAGANERQSIGHLVVTRTVKLKLTGQCDKCYR